MATKEARIQLLLAKELREEGGGGGVSVIKYNSPIYYDSKYVRSRALCLFSCTYISNAAEKKESSCRCSGGRGGGEGEGHNEC